MQVPSGRILDDLDQAIIMMMAKHGSIVWTREGKTLYPGLTTNFYISTREDMTRNPDFEWLIGRKIARLIQANSGGVDPRQVCLIGIPATGTALAQAASMVSFREKILVRGQPICHAVMKEKRKQHGLNSGWVGDGASTEKIARYDHWVIDNAVTTGRSLIEGYERLYADLFPTEYIPAVILVDRQQGGLAKLNQAGLTEIFTAYNILDILFVFGELKLWDKVIIAATIEEIKNKQIA